MLKKSNFLYSSSCNSLIICLIHEGCVFFVTSIVYYVSCKVSPGG